MMRPGDPSYAEAFRAYQAGDLAACAQHAAAALGADPDHGPAMLLRAVSCPDDEPVRARALYAAACRHAPHDADAWFNLGVHLEGRRLRTEAVAAYRRALVYSPGHFGALLNGTQLVRIHEYFEEALGLARRLQQVAPEHWAGYAHEAISLQHLGFLDEADEVFEAAFARSPDPTLLHWEHHFSLLAREMFAPAWAKYELRFACSEANGVEDIPFGLPHWNGSAGGHVLVYGEQGLGDQLMFAGALADLAARVDRVTLAVHPALTRLFAASYPDMAVVPIANGRDEAERQAVLQAAGRELPVGSVLPIGSLMARFRNARADFSGSPYLRPSEESRRFWAERGSADRGDGALRVGLCWASNPAPDRFFSSRRARNKTMPLSIMQRLATRPGIAATAVTNVPLGAFRPSAKAIERIEDVSADLVDLDRTAALLEKLDLLITVDTGVAHLAGALGVPVWILLHTGGDARWGIRGSESSYWYNSARLFWQQDHGDWDELVDRVGAALDRLRRSVQRREAAE